MSTLNMYILITAHPFNKEWVVYGYTSYSESEKLKSFKTKSEALEYVSGFSMTPVMFSTGSPVYATLQKLSQKPQRQDSLTNQLIDLKSIAVKEGMYDAVDWINNRRS